MEWRNRMGSPRGGSRRSRAGRASAVRSSVSRRGSNAIDPGVRGEHRRSFGDGERLGTERREPCRTAERRGRRDCRDGIGATGARPHAVGVQRRDQLAQQERIPSVQRCRRGRTRRDNAIVSGLEQPRDGRLPQRRPAQYDGHRCARDTVVQLGIGAWLTGAPGDEDEQRNAVEPASEIREPAQRRGIGPVGVVNNEHQRRVGGELRRKPAEPVRGSVQTSAVGVGSASRRIGTASVAAPARISARAPSPRSRSGRSKSWRTTPKASSRSSWDLIRSRRSAGVQSGRRPASSSAASRYRPDLPPRSRAASGCRVPAGRRQLRDFALSLEEVCPSMLDGIAGEPYPSPTGSSACAPSRCRCSWRGEAVGVVLPAASD